MQPTARFSGCSQLSPVPKVCRQASLQGEDGKDGLRKLQHPHRGINGAGVFPVFGKVNERRDEFIKGKSSGGDDHDFTGFFHPVPVDHLKHDADEGQVHQQNQHTAEAVRLPLFFNCSRIFPAQDLEQLDQCLDKVVDAVRTDPGRAYDHSGHNLENAVGKVNELFQVQFQREFQFLIFQYTLHPGVVLQPVFLHPDSTGQLNT